MTTKAKEYTVDKDLESLVAKDIKEMFDNKDNIVFNSEDFSYETKVRLFWENKGIAFGND